jgi:hypothetical protein
VTEAKAPDGGCVVVAYFFLFGIESNSLAYNGGLRAGGTPYGEWHLEADGEDAVRGKFGCAMAERMFFVYFVGRLCPFEVGRDISPHVEALHGGRVLWQGPWEKKVERLMLREDGLVLSHGL